MSRRFFCRISFFISVNKTLLLRKYSSFAPYEKKGDNRRDGHGGILRPFRRLRRVRFELPRHGEFVSDAFFFRMEQDGIGFANARYEFVGFHGFVRKSRHRYGSESQLGRAYHGMIGVRDSSVVNWRRSFELAWRNLIPPVSPIFRKRYGKMGSLKQQRRFE